MKRGTKKSPILDAKRFEAQKYRVDGNLVEVSDGQAILKNYTEKRILNGNENSKLYVQLAQTNQSSLHNEENRITEIGSSINQQQQSAQHSSSTSHLQTKSDSGSSAAVMRVTNLIGAIKGAKSDHRQRQYSVTEPNTSSSNEEVIFDYTTVNDNQHSLCLTTSKQLNAIEFDPASLPLASTFHQQKDKHDNGKTFNRNKIKRQSTPEEASDSSESLGEKDIEFSSNNNGPNYDSSAANHHHNHHLDHQLQQPPTYQQCASSQQSIAKSFKNRFQHSIFHQASSSTPPTTTLSVHYSGSQTSFSNSSSAFNQQQPSTHSTKFSSFNLLRRYKSRFHRANNATCFSNFEVSSHSRPSIGVVSATSTPEVTSPSGNSPKADEQSFSNQLPDLKEETITITPHLKTINRNYLSATFKSTTCSALSKIASNKNKTMNKKLASSLHTLNVVPIEIHRTKSEDASNYGLLHAVSQKLQEEQQQNLIDEEISGSSKLKRKSLGRLSIGSIGANLAASTDQTTTTNGKIRSSNSCLNVYGQTILDVHRDSTTSNSNPKTSSDTTQKTSSGQTVAPFTSSSASGPTSSGGIQPEKTSQNSNISECNQRCISPASMLQLPSRFFNI